MRWFLSSLCLLLASFPRVAMSALLLGTSWTTQLAVLSRFILRSLGIIYAIKLHVSLLRFSIRYKKFMICHSFELRQAVKGLMTVFWGRFPTIYCLNCLNWVRGNHFFRDDYKVEIPCDILSEITMERLLKWNLMLTQFKHKIDASLLHFFLY